MARLHRHWLCQFQVTGEWIWSAFLLLWLSLFKSVFNPSILWSLYRLHNNFILCWQQRPKKHYDFRMGSINSRSNNGGGCSQYNSGFCGYVSSRIGHWQWDEHFYDFHGVGIRGWFSPKIDGSYSTLFHGRWFTYNSILLSIQRFLDNDIILHTNTLGNYACTHACVPVIISYVFG